MEGTSTERPSDADLVAYLDGELAADRLAWMEGWLARDAELGARHDLLASGGRRFGEAFGPLLAAAPRARLENLLQSALAGQPAEASVARPLFGHASLRSRTWQRLGLIAAGVLLFLAGALVQSELPVLRDALGVETAAQDADEWRQAAAQYVSLYTTDTLSGIPDDMAPRERELAKLSSRLGIALPLTSVSLPGLALKRIQLLAYEGKPLGQVAYLDPHDGPLALCIYASETGDNAPLSERRAGLNVVHWSSRGRAFMLVGHMPQPRLQELASLLSRRITL
jgi:anti-sigma factor RsiW